MEDLTSNFVYLRLHVDKELYKTGYDDVSLKWWARRLKIWQAGTEASDALTISGQQPKQQRRDAYVFFDNDVKVHAPFDAKRLQALLRHPRLKKLA